MSLQTYLPSCAKDTKLSSCRTFQQLYTRTVLSSHEMNAVDVETILTSRVNIRTVLDYEKIAGHSTRLATKFGYRTRL